MTRDAQTLSTSATHTCTSTVPREICPRAKISLTSDSCEETTGNVSECDTRCVWIGWTLWWLSLRPVCALWICQRQFFFSFLFLWVKIILKKKSSLLIRLDKNESNFSLSWHLIVPSTGQFFFSPGLEVHAMPGYFALSPTLCTCSPIRLCALETRDMDLPPPFQMNEAFFSPFSASMKMAESCFSGSSLCLCGEGCLRTMG